MCVPNGFVLPKGAWVVRLGNCASVIMRYCVQDIWGPNPPRTPGTSLLSGPTPPQPPPVAPIPINPPPGSNANPSVPVYGGSPKTQPRCQPKQWNWMGWNDYLEAFRAWQRATGNTTIQMDPPGRAPPNWFGPMTDISWQTFTLLPAGQNGTVLSDGYNVQISGNGAMIIQAYSV